MTASTSDDQLRGFIRRVLALREERSAITADIADVLSEAKSTGFDRVKISEVCRWLERCDKHGRDAMIEAESVFDLYRDVAEGPAKPLAEMFDAARDKVLVEMFAAPPEPEKSPKRIKTLNAHRAAADQARRAFRGEI